MRCNMTIYNFNKGIGWASSGVEYAQAYRAKIFRKNGQQAKFIFTDLLNENIGSLTKNMGFEEKEIIWLYQYFTDIKIAPTTYTLESLVSTFPNSPCKIISEENIIAYHFDNGHVIMNVFFDKKTKDKFVYKVETIINGSLIQRDYYSYVKTFSEYYKPVNGGNNIYQRRFFNTDGSIAYEEVLNGKQSLFIFDDRTIYSFENLLVYFLECLKLTSRDILILDRSTDIAPAILKSRGDSKVGVIIHAEHFTDNITNDDYILWNNNYEYVFKNVELIDFFVCATDKQKQIIEEQFKKYKNSKIKQYTIPVGSIEELKYNNKRRPNSLITASRLADEKHIDWLVEAVVRAHKSLEELTFDIYGEGTLRSEIEKLILEHHAQEYIHLKGQQNLTNIYSQYQNYISASTSEGFGLTLLEAVGSGLPLIGFDVRYGNQNFIQPDQNGYLIKYEENQKERNIEVLSQAILKLNRLTSLELDSFREKSYDIAKQFMINMLQEKWLLLEKEQICD